MRGETKAMAKVVMRDGNVAMLESWLSANAVWWDRAAIQISSGQDTQDMYVNDRPSMNISALRPLAVDEVIAHIPKSCVLSPLGTAIGQVLVDEEVAGSLALTVALLYERSLGERSRWFGYLKTLPTCVDGLPLVWMHRRRDVLKREGSKRKRDSSGSSSLPASASTMTTSSDMDTALSLLLRYTEIGSTLAHDYRLLRQDYDVSIVPLLDAHPAFFGTDEEYRQRWFSYDVFLNAATVVASRCFQLDDGVHGDALVPLADVFNHRTAVESVHLECSAGSVARNADHVQREDGDDPDTIVMRIVRPVTNRHDEVWNTYGDHSASFLLMKYGFVEEVPNPYDVVTFGVEDVRGAMTELLEDEDEFVRRVKLWCDRKEAEVERASIEDGQREYASEEDQDGEETEVEDEQKHHSADDREQEHHSVDDSEQEQECSTEDAEQSSDSDHSIASSNTDDDAMAELHFQLRADGTLDPDFLPFLSMVTTSDQDMNAADDNDGVSLQPSSIAISPRAHSLLLAMIDSRLRRRKLTAADAKLMDAGGEYVEMVRRLYRRELYILQRAREVVMAMGEVGGK